MTVSRLSIRFRLVSIKLILEARVKSNKNKMTTTTSYKKHVMILFLARKNDCRKTRPLLRNHNMGGREQISKRRRHMLPQEIFLFINTLGKPAFLAMCVQYCKKLNERAK